FFVVCTNLFCFDLERVRKLNAICYESVGQTEKGIAALSSFFPIDNPAAKAIEPRVRSLHHPSASLAARMLRSVLGPSAFRGDLWRVVLAAQGLSRRLIVKSRV